IDTEVAPWQEPQIGAELRDLKIMFVVEIADDVDRVALERRHLSRRGDIDVGDRRGIDARGFRESRPHDTRCVTRRVADLAAGKALRSSDARTFQPVEALR